MRLCARHASMTRCEPHCRRAGDHGSFDHRCRCTSPFPPRPSLCPVLVPLREWIAFPLPGVTRTQRKATNATTMKATVTEGNQRLWPPFSSLPTRGYLLLYFLSDSISLSIVSTFYREIDRGDVSIPGRIGVTRTRLFGNIWENGWKCFSKRLR